MVSFICDGCQDTVKKPKVLLHLSRCRSPSVSCVDCSATFTRSNVAAHTACLTEVEKYHGSKASGPFCATCNMDIGHGAVAAEQHRNSKRHRASLRREARADSFNGGDVREMGKRVKELLDRSSSRTSPAAPSPPSDGSQHPHASAKREPHQEPFRRTVSTPQERLPTVERPITPNIDRSLSTVGDENKPPRDAAYSGMGVGERITHRPADDLLSPEKKRSGGKTTPGIWKVIKKILKESTGRRKKVKKLINEVAVRLPGVDAELIAAKIQKYGKAERRLSIESDYARLV